jgi:hypothetical protein
MLFRFPTWSRERRGKHVLTTECSALDVLGGELDVRFKEAAGVRI